ncbi:MAG TPA: DUF4230 domain-containing protein [Acidobacteriaceae bacterium]
MTSQYEYYGNRRGSGVLFAVLLSLVIGATLLGVFVHRARSGWPGRLASAIAGRSLTIISAPDVVEKIQRLNRLESVKYSLDTVVEGQESSPILPDALAGDKLLMIVHGSTVAGVDLSQLKPDNVQITDGANGRSIRLTLPPSQVFATTLDETKTRVYSRQTGLLVSADPNLESETRAKAQAQLQQAALSDGILDAASQNARVAVTAMLEGLGFTRVDLQ